MSNFPTIRYPYVIEIQINKKGRWSATCSIRSDMTKDYALSSLGGFRDRQPAHNFRLLVMEIIE